MAEKVSQEEYRQKERQQKHYEAEKAKEEKKIQSLDEEISRLEKAVKVLRQCNSAFKTESEELKELIGDSVDIPEFKGDTNKEIIGRDGRSLSDEGRRCHRNEINRALDDLEWALTQKKNQRDKALGLLGEIKSALRSIGTWFRTHFN